jgi:4-amino-4-deoxy-L-arabinose transferase-like glycosyltransferase
MLASTPCSSPKERRFDSVFPSFCLFVVPLTLFLGIHLVLSLLISQSFRSDDADLLIFSQSLALGYHDQPPLYSWLAWSFFQLFGLQVFSLALLKSLILGFLFAGLHQSARLLLGDDRRAILAAFSPLLIVAFSWHSLAYLTHTNLLCAICTATLCAVLRIHRGGGWFDYALLGILLGLGMLSKYNYLLFVASILLAGLSIPSFRARIADRRLLLTFGLAAMMVLPHAFWLADHWKEIIRVLSGKTGVGRAQEPIAGMAVGGAALLTNLLLTPAPLVIVFLFCFPWAFRWIKRPPNQEADEDRLLERFFVAVVCLLLLQVLAGGTRFHDRWLLPFSLLVPLCLFGRLRYCTLPARRIRGFACVLSACAVILTIARACQIFVGGIDDDAYPLQMSFAESAQSLEKAGGGQATIVTGDRDICGNLRCWLPHASVLCAYHSQYRPPELKSHDRCIIVWNTKTGETLPAYLSSFVAEELQIKPPSDAPLHFVNVGTRWTSRKTNRLAYIVLALSDNASRAGLIQAVPNNER